MGCVFRVTQIAVKGQPQHTPCGHVADGSLNHARTALLPRVEPREQRTEVANGRQVVNIVLLLEHIVFKRGGTRGGQGQGCRGLFVHFRPSTMAMDRVGWMDRLMSDITDRSAAAGPPSTSAAKLDCAGRRPRSLATTPTRSPWDRSALRTIPPRSQAIVPEDAPLEDSPIGARLT